MFLDTNNKLSTREIKKTITSKRIKYLRINLTEEVEDLYPEKYKTLKKTQINGKIIYINGLEEYC